MNKYLNTIFIIALYAQVFRLYLIAVALGIGQFGIESSANTSLFDRILAILVLPIAILLFTFVLNLYFQRLTWTCRQLQEWVERALNDGTSLVCAVHISPHEWKKKDIKRNLNCDGHILVRKAFDRVPLKRTDTAVTTSQKFIHLLNSYIRERRISQLSKLIVALKGEAYTSADLRRSLERIAKLRSTV